MMTKNLVVKIQNLVVNHESRPVKSNSVCPKISEENTVWILLSVRNKKHKSIVLICSELAIKTFEYRPGYKL